MDDQLLDQILDIISNEDELSGPVPDGPYKLYLESILADQDMDRLIEALRMTVRTTKSCLINKIDKLRGPE